MLDEKAPLPNFLIVGAAKCGTTSLHEYLKQHPDVFMPDWKEPSYFAPPEAGGVQDFSAYRKLFENGEGKRLIGESSVAYLYVSDSAKRIQNALGNIKIIILLRNPVDMAYSNWGHQKREGFETLGFEDAMRRPFENTPKAIATWSENLAYIDRAHYRPQIERYDQIFPDKHIKIYLYEEFFQNDLPLWNDLCDFLGISSAFRPDNKRYNSAGSSRFPIIQQLLNGTGAWKEVIKVMLPRNLRQEIRSWLEKTNRKDKALRPIAQETRSQLEEIFNDDVRWLENRLKRSLKDVWF